MITKITGQLLALADEIATLRVEAFEYEVRITDYTRRQLQSQLGQAISLHTIQYLEGSNMASRMTPRLIGFVNVAEREFFDLICSVDGVGVKKALRAMTRPVRDFAIAIEEQDTKSLAALPGIGAATAERIVAKLRRKVPKFALLVDRLESHEAQVEHDVIKESYEALRSLGHSEAESRRLLDNVLKAKKKFPDVESVLAAIYQAQRG
ncbi:MAG: Holliday junction DNA helicase RuvA [Planctomycetes bacterium]|nr:Holliday junction DNA helicase RuvA [Planctomycetota bacterium]